MAFFGAGNAGLLCSVVMAGAASISAQALAQEPLRAESSQPVIESVTASARDGAEVVRIDLSEPLPSVPAGFAIEQPSRIALDLPPMAVRPGAELTEFGQSNLVSARIARTGERTRLVLNLRKTVPWKAEVSGKSLLIFLQAAGSASSAKGISFPAKPHRATATVKDIDFRRFDGGGRISIDLSGPEADVDVRHEGRKLVVEFLGTDLAQGLRRRLDVADFGTPVQTFTTLAVGDRVRIEVEAAGDWEHSAYQRDSQFVLEIRKRVAASPPAGPRYSGEKLSLNFQNIDVRALLQVMADFSEFNIVTSDSVTGALTLRLKDIPWDQALDIVLQARGLGMRRSGNVLWIAPRDEMAAKEKAELEAAAALRSLEPVRTQAFQLNHAKATDVAAHLGAGPVANRVLSERGSAVPEPRTNQLFVTDVAMRLEAAQQMIAKIDIPVRQVLIEARIVEASDTFGKSLGARLGLSGTYSAGGGRQVAFGNNYDAVSSATGQTSASDTSSSLVNLPASGQSGSSAATFAISLFNAGADRYLNLELSALEADGKGRIVSSPRIVTANQAKAIIEQGTEFPYQQATSSGATSVAFRKATLKLEVTPQITPDGGVILDLEINKDSRGETTTAGVAIDTKHIRTQALVENGGTIVIGGIYELTESNSETRVPLLGELPAVGGMFRSRGTTSNKQEMLIFITPRIVVDAKRAS